MAHFASILFDGSGSFQSVKFFLSKIRCVERSVQDIVTLSNKSPWTIVSKKDIRRFHQDSRLVYDKLNGDFFLGVDSTLPFCLITECNPETYIPIVKGVECD